MPGLCTVCARHLEQQQAEPLPSGFQQAGPPDAGTTTVRSMAAVQTTTTRIPASETDRISEGFRRLEAQIALHHDDVLRRLEQNAHHHDRRLAEINLRLDTIDARLTVLETPQATPGADADVAAAADGWQDVTPAAADDVAAIVAW